MLIWIKDHKNLTIKVSIQSRLLKQQNYPSEFGIWLQHSTHISPNNLVSLKVIKRKSDTTARDNGTK